MTRGVHRAQVKDKQKGAGKRVKDAEKVLEGKRAKGSDSCLVTQEDIVPNI